jgi:simple sugar transport system substrate-binding protein
MRRKLAASAMAALLTLSACSGSGGKKAAEKATKGLSGGGPRIKIAMITHSAQGDAFWDIVQKGAKSAAAKDNVQFLYAADPEGGKQAQLVQSSIDQHVDGLIVTLAKPDALKDAIAKAIAAKIPVVTINSGAEDSAAFGAIAHFGQDETIAGQAAGARLGKAGLKNVICLVHEQGNVGLEQRCAGAKKTFSGKLTNLFVQGANMPQVKAAVTAKLQADKSIDGILALNAQVALTAAAAAKDSSAVAKVATFDLNQDLIAAVRDGRVLFAVDQQPYLQGYEAVDELWLYKNNGDVIGGGRPVLTGPAIVDRSDVDAVAPYADRGTR